LWQRTSSREATAPEGRDSVSSFTPSTITALGFEVIVTELPSGKPRMKTSSFVLHAVRVRSNAEAEDPGSSDGA
jgi:hypothetical protein